MIIDAHAHMITLNIVRAMGYIPPHAKTRLSHEWGEHTPQEHTTAWLAAMDHYNIEKTYFMATATLHKEFITFINSSSRFVGFARLPLSKPDSFDILKQEIKAGMRGVKIYATSEGVDLSNQEFYPIYEFCQENKIPIVIHFGVTIGWDADLIYGNPLLLSRVLRHFPNLTFIIAHFGAGFFREVLLLKYKQDNLYVDTSGTNNWLLHQDNYFTLKDVFKKTLDVYGPKHILFGSDTRIFPDGYRANILEEQTTILNELGLSTKEKAFIMGGNARRMIGAS